MNRRGLTLIEIVISTALLVFLTAVGIRLANPYGQLATARNTQRTLNIQAIMNAIRQNIAEQSGQAFSCETASIPTSTKKMATGAGNYNIAPCLIPMYLLVMPYDPSASSAYYTSNEDYDTGYRIVINSSTSQITISAPSAELGKTISIIR